MDILQNINIDFQVLDTKDPRIITIADSSMWGHIVNKPSIIEIIMPGEKNPIVHYFMKKQLNIFNSINLALNCVSECGGTELLDLPDGIYTITVKGSPDSFNMTRKYLRTTKTQLELDKLYIRLNLLCQKGDFNDLKNLTDIMLLLKAAEANVRYDNIKTAQELFFKAQDLIEKLKKCKGCVGV